MVEFSLVGFKYLTKIKAMESFLYLLVSDRVMEKYIIAVALAALFLLSACGTGNAAADVNDDKPDCVDTDDGIKPGIKGRVTGYDEEGKYLIDEADRCLPPFLHEYYCEDGVVKSRNIRCRICDRGVCPMVVQI
jgi:hypothetical protein